jgi:predicted phage terminase large subunit-like protein
MSLLAETIAPSAEGLTASCEIDLHTFVREAWPIVVPAEVFQDNWHIGAICEHLEALVDRELFNLLINIPPRFGKSVLCSVMLPAWLWVKDPTMRMVYSSYAASLSTRDSLATRRLVESDWYRSQWADRYTITTDQNEKTRFENDKKGFRLATSVGGVATGEGGDLVVVDDPHNVNEAESDVVRKGVLDWWNVTMPSRTGRGGRSLRLVIMQRVHEEDLSGDIIKKGAYTHLCIPMEYESTNSQKGWNGWSDPRTEDGELAWKARFTEAVIAATLKPPHMSSYAYAGQFQQHPAPIEGGMFLRKWWKYYTIAPEALLAKAQDKCWSWDMTFKDLKTSDYVCGTAWVRIGADFYLLPHAVHDKLGFSASKAAVKSCSALWPQIHYKLVEDKANGTAIIEDLTHAIGGLRAVEPHGGKESRASRVQPYAEAGNIYLPDPSVASWVELFVEEFRVFPNGAHDDYVDSTSQALTWMLDRMERGFAPFTVGLNRSTSRQHDGELFRDPRYGDAPILIPKKSDRGDERAADALRHDVDNAEHRSTCRACRAQWKSRP